MSGLYKGLGPTVVKQGSNQAIRFFVMESLRTWYTEGRADQSVPYYLVALFGAMAGGASVLGNTPVDVLKTRMQSGKYRNKDISFCPLFSLIVSRRKDIDDGHQVELGMHQVHRQDGRSPRVLQGMSAQAQQGLHRSGSGLLYIRHRPEDVREGVASVVRYLFRVVFSCTHIKNIDLVLFYLLTVLSIKT